MTKLMIEEVVESKSGNAWRVKSGATWYNAFKDSGIELHKGKMIEADITTSEKYGPGIQKYKVIESSPPTAPSGGAPTYSQTSTPFWMPFASNVVAHAISAGLVKEPTELKQWVFAAKAAAEGAVANDIPF